MHSYTQTLDMVFNNPESFEVRFAHKDVSYLFRPLEKNDASSLVELIESLSLETSRFYSYKDDAASIAAELIDSIRKYDKLRFVLVEDVSLKIVGLFEFSFDIPEGDVERFQKYGIELETKACFRLGPLLADDYQSKGLGLRVLDELFKLALEFGQRSIILWGGVHADNGQALRFYEKAGFAKVGEFVNQDELVCFDMYLEEIPSEKL